MSTKKKSVPKCNKIKYLLTIHQCVWKLIEWLTKLVEDLPKSLTNQHKFWFFYFELRLVLRRQCCEMKQSYKYHSLKEISLLGISWCLVLKHLQLIIFNLIISNAIPPIAYTSTAQIYHKKCLYNIYLFISYQKTKIGS